MNFLLSIDHPFYFAIDTDSYVGLGHSDGSNPYIERDWYRYDALDGTWSREADFSSYALDVPDALPVTTEARVAGTQFSVAGSCSSDKILGFILSGDGDNHGTMETGEFHVFDPADSSIWHSLPPHPGYSRWAPGSFVLQGSSRAYFLGGYDRQQRIMFSDLWTIDLESILDTDATVPDSNETELDDDFLLDKDATVIDSNETELNDDFQEEIFVQQTSQEGSFGQQTSELQMFESSSVLPSIYLGHCMILLVTLSILAPGLALSL